MIKKNTGILIFVILIVLAILFNNYSIYKFKGESLCEVGHDNCRIHPGDIILTKNADASSIDYNDVLCTDDEVCHVLKSTNSDGFCTEGLNAFSLNKCYDWSELESKVEWVIPTSFINFILVMAVILILFQSNKCGCG